MPEGIAMIAALAMMYVCGRLVEQIKQNQREARRRRRAHEISKRCNWY